MLNANFGRKVAERVRIPLFEMMQNGWIIAVLVIAVSALIPILALVVLSLSPTVDVWIHLISTVLPRALYTTLFLMIGVGIMTAIFGVGTAWVSHYV